MIVGSVVGNLGRDARIKDVNGRDVLEFSIASNRRFKGQDLTQWVDCSIWGKRASALAQHMTRGKRVFVNGELSMRQFTKKDGSAGTSLELEVDQLQLLGDGQGRGAASAQAPDPAGEVETAPDDGDFPF